MRVPLPRRAVLHVAALAALAAGAAPAAAGDPKGRVSRYRGDGDPSDSDGPNAGTAVGTVAYAPGAFGQAFSFGGAGYVDVAGSTFDQYAAGFTVSAWIKMTSYSNPASVVNLRTPANASGFSLEQLSGNDGTMSFGVNQSGTAGDFAQVNAAGWKTGVLYHVAVTFDAVSGSMTLYRDGKAVASRHDLPKKSMATAADDFQIGHNIVSTGAYWKGLIDEVRFYGRALSPVEIGEIGTRTTLVAHWRFDEPPGTLVVDDDAGLYKGGLNGGAAFVAGGISGNCVSLARATNSHVYMGGPAFPDFTSGDFSISAWVNTTTTDTNSFVCSKHTGGVKAGYIVNVNQMGTVNDYGAAGKTNLYVSADPGQEVTSATTVTDGAWHQIVAVYRAGVSQTIYVDGAPAEATKAPPAMVADTAPFLVGGYSNAGTATGNFTGLVDDVQVYSGALTDGQIDYLHAHPGQPIPAAQFDLAADWSDDANPNGTWTLREGANALPHVAAWGALPDYVGTQPAWARSSAAGGNTYLPAWLRSVGAETFTHDWLAGDVVVHATDGTSGVGAGNADVVWTSPFSGVVDVTGGVWAGREIGRGADWFLYRNATLLSQGTVASGDAYDRVHPFALSAGTGGAAALSAVAVAPNDQLRLEFAKTSTFGDYVGVNLAVAVADARRVVSYFLPTSVALKLVAAGKDSLAVTGVFDDGGGTVDLAQPVTFTIGGYSTGPITLVAGAFKDANLSLAVKSALKGTSRGTFALSLKNATLSGVVDPAAEVETHLSAAGMPDATGRVKLAGGAFKLGKVPGALVLPAVSPTKVAVTANDAKPDALSLTAVFTAGGFQPTTYFQCRVALGDQFDEVLAGFKPKGPSKFVYSGKGKVGSGTISATIDFKKGTFSLKSKGVEVGALAGPTEDFLFDLDLGDGPVITRVRLAASGPKRTY